MATYAIGDLQGCHNELSELLKIIKFNKETDYLWFTGDLVNRGPKSLDVLRLIKSLNDRAITVLGNHDFHLLAILAGTEIPRSKDTLDAILMAPDREELFDWLRHRPLMHYDAELNWVMVHAGIAPMWNLAQAQACATELETILKSDNYRDFFQHMYGEEPSQWNDHLTGFDRLRLICNYFTRTRFCDVAGKLNLKIKTGLAVTHENLFPWYQLLRKWPSSIKIVFGHWAALQGQSNSTQAICVDTGCVWGNRLSALRLEDQQLFSVSAEKIYSK